MEEKGTLKVCEQVLGSDMNETRGVIEYESESQCLNGSDKAEGTRQTFSAFPTERHLEPTFTRGCRAGSRFIAEEVCVRSIERFVKMGPPHDVENRLKESKASVKAGKPGRK